MLFRSRTALELENIALRHQLAVLNRSVKRPKTATADRVFWAWCCKVWSEWQSALLSFKPETVIAWHRKGFRLFWTWKTRRGKPGRPAVPKEIRDLIRRISRENPLWLLVLAHDRRRILHCSVTTHPTAEWTAQQRREAFPFEQGPRYLLPDRDHIFRHEFTRQVEAMDITEGA